MVNIMRSLFSIFFMILCCFSSAAHSEEPQLYETGPSEESSYVRFVNATDEPVVITSSAGNAKVSLSTKDDGRVSHFFTVKAGSKLSAVIQEGAGKVAVSVTGKPWEYITIAVLPDGVGKVKTMLVRETPTDFNGVRASFALFNLDAKCGAATLQGGSKNTPIVENIKPYTVGRRLINPVKLSASLICEGERNMSDFPQLQAGERYSVFVLSLKNVRQSFIVRDAN